MAVYCGVCAVQIGNAFENEGSFQVAADFKGWDKRDDKPRIADTCEFCAPALRKAVAYAASQIAAKHRTRINELARKIAEEDARLAEAKKREARERAEFEEWKRGKKS